MSTLSSNKLLCYNRGCGKDYTEEENTDKSCQFHPGVPVFHEGYKGWSCCSKKTTDFTEFLNIKGCKIDFHSNVKPVIEVTNKMSDIKIEKEEPTIKPVYVPMERPPFDSNLVSLKFIIGNSLKPIIEKLKENASDQCGDTENNQTVDLTNIPIGTICKNPSCKKSYVGAESIEEDCLYHNGVAVFHEGLKYWTCCQRRTTDFESFLAQEGCEVGKHKWFKTKADMNLDKSKTCRYDWHQTGDNIVVSIYSKNPIPHESSIEVNQVRLKISIVFGVNEKQEFEMDIPLYGIIDIEKSFVTYLATKVEVTLKKAEPIHWKYVQIESRN